MRPVIQMVFLMNSLGIAISTQIAKHFLGGDEQVHSMIRHATSDDIASPDPVQTLYLLVGALDVAMASVCVLTCVGSCSIARRCCIGVAVCLRDADDNEDLLLIPDGDSSDLEEAHSLRANQRVEPCSRQGYILLSLIFIFLVMIHAHDLMMKYLLFTYLYEYLGWSVGDSTLLILVYQMIRFVFGALSVPVSRWVSPTKLLVFDLFISVSAGTLMLLALVFGATFTVQGVVLTGVGSANVQPSTIALVDETIHVVASVMSLLLSTLGFCQLGVSLTGTLLYFAGEAAFPAMIFAFIMASVTIFILYKVFRCVMMSSSSSSNSHLGWSKKK